MSRSFLTLDGLRGVAALCIVVLHSGRYFGETAHTSFALAVDLFFVLSGFVLGFAYSGRLGDGMTPWEFIRARIIRLYPLYLFGTMLGLIEAMATIYGPPSPTPWDWGKFWTSLPFALFMIPAPGQANLFPFNGVMWSIFFEVLINVVWAVFWRPFQSTRVLIWVIVLSGVGLAASVAYWNTMWLGVTWNSLFGGLFRVSYSFFLGLLLWRLHGKVKPPKVPPIVLMAALPALLALPMPVWVRLLVALAVLPWFVFLGAQVEPRGLLSTACRNLGSASYAIYATHRRLYMLSYGALLLVGIDLQAFQPWVGILFVAGLIPFCVLLDRHFDAPARKWLSRRFGGRPRIRGPATAP